MDLFNKSDSIVNRDAVCHPVKRLELAFTFGLKFPVGGSVPVLFISMVPVFRLVGLGHIYILIRLVSTTGKLSQSHKF